MLLRVLPNTLHFPREKKKKEKNEEEKEQEGGGERGGRSQEMVREMKEWLSKQPQRESTSL